MNKILKSFYIIKAHGVVFFFNRLGEYLRIKLRARKAPHPVPGTTEQASESFHQTKDCRPTQKRLEEFVSYAGTDTEIVIATIDKHKSGMLEIFIGEYKRNVH